MNGITRTAGGGIPAALSGPGRAFAATAAGRPLPAPGEFLRSLADRIDRERAAGCAPVFAIRLTDIDEIWMVSVADGVLHAERRDAVPAGTTTLSGRRARVFAAFSGGTAAVSAEEGGEMLLSGDPEPFRLFQAMLGPAGAAEGR